MSMERIVPDEVISPDLEEARAATVQARQGAEDLWTGLARIHRCRGWTTLGYSSFRQWAHAELDMSLQSADLYLRKTKALLELQQVWNQPLASLAPMIPLRSVSRKPSKHTPVARSMLAATRKLAETPILANPDERAAAVALWDELSRLLAR